MSLHPAAYQQQPQMMNLPGQQQQQQRRAWWPNNNSGKSPTWMSAIHPSAAGSQLSRSPSLSVTPSLDRPPVDCPPRTYSTLCKPDYNVSNPLCPVRDLGTKSVHCNKNLKKNFSGSSPRPDKVHYNFISVSKTTCRRPNWIVSPFSLIHVIA